MHTYPPTQDGKKAASLLPQAIFFLSLNLSFDLFVLALSGPQSVPLDNNYMYVARSAIAKMDHLGCSLVVYIIYCMYMYMYVPIYCLNTP